MHFEYCTCESHVLIFLILLHWRLHEDGDESLKYEGEYVTGNLLFYTLCFHTYIANSQLSFSPKVAKDEIDVHKFSKRLGVTSNF